MKRYVINLSYDGTFFRGWQIQNEGRTVQDTLEKALTKIAKINIKVAGSGRTDAGVHALNQFAHFDFPINMSPLQVKFALRSALPHDIRIKNVFHAEDNFNARYDALAREYLYVIGTKRTPFNRFYKSFLPKMKLGDLHPYLDIFKGKHDFSAFSKKNPDLDNYFCTITDFDIKTDGNNYIFRIRANRFLHNMVRRIIGTILEAQTKDIEPLQLKKLLENDLTAKRNLIFTAPPQGLYLANVIYDKDFYQYEEPFNNNFSD